MGHEETTDTIQAWDDFIIQRRREEAENARLEREANLTDEERVVDALFAKAQAYLDQHADEDGILTKARTKTYEGMLDEGRQARYAIKHDAYNADGWGYAETFQEDATPEARGHRRHRQLLHLRPLPLPAEGMAGRARCVPRRHRVRRAARV